MTKTHRRQFNELLIGAARALLALGWFLFYISLAALVIITTLLVFTEGEHLVGKAYEGYFIFSFVVTMVAFVFFFAKWKELKKGERQVSVVLACAFPALGWFLFCIFLTAFAVLVVALVFTEGKYLVGKAYEGYLMGFTVAVTVFSVAFVAKWKKLKKGERQVMAVLRALASDIAETVCRLGALLIWAGLVIGGAAAVGLVIISSGAVLAQITPMTIVIVLLLWILLKLYENDK